MIFYDYIVHYITYINIVYNTIYVYNICIIYIYYDNVFGEVVTVTVFSFTHILCFEWFHLR